MASLSWSTNTQFQQSCQRSLCLYTMGKALPKQRSAPKTRALVLYPHLRHKSLRDPELGLSEGVSLAQALPDLDVVGAQIVPLATPDPGTLLGRGKTESLASLIQSEDVALVLIDGAVTPVQQRNLEKSWNCKLLDRTGLILEIFADRAATREGVLQVELAALRYQRTRLVRAWTHLERQRGGLGFVGGPGETQIEADRRAIDTAIGRIKRQIGKVVKTRTLHRAARAKVPYPVVALVGYTNAGKSTLFNQLSGSSVIAKDMLFATLDPTMRAVKLEKGLEVVLSDTVGFISDLPPQLVAAFQATLEEVLSADLIVHVRDISHPETKQQAENVRQILADLGVSQDRPILELWNKIDVLSAEALQTVQTIAARRRDVFPLSAITREGLPPALRAIEDWLSPRKYHVRLQLPIGASAARAWLYAAGAVEQEGVEEDCLMLDIHWNVKQAAQFRHRFPDLSHNT